MRGHLMKLLDRLVIPLDGNIETLLDMACKHASALRVVRSSRPHINTAEISTGMRGLIGLVAHLKAPMAMVREHG